jgi:PAS domain S-box-containing protein
MKLEPAPVPDAYLPEVDVDDAAEQRERDAAAARARAGAEAAARRLAAFLDATAALGAARDVAAVARVSAERLHSVLGARAAAVRLVRAGGLELVAGAGDPDPSVQRAAVVAAGQALRGDARWLEDAATVRARLPEVAPALLEGGCAAAGLPLVAAGRPLGALGVFFDRDRELDLEERAFALALCEQCAHALDRAFLHEREQGSRAVAAAAAERLARLQSMTAALSASRTVSEVGAAVTAHAGPVLGAAAAITHAVTADGRTLRLADPGGLPTAAIVRLATAPVDGPLPCAEAARTGAPLWCAGAAECRARFPEMAEVLPGGGPSSLAALPLAADGRVVGTLVVLYPGPRAFDRDERGFLVTVAQQCAQALDRARLFEAERDARGDAQRTAAHLGQLASIAEALSASLTPDEVADAMVRRARPLLGASVSALYVREGTDRLRLLGTRGADPAAAERFATVPLDAPYPVCDAVRTGQAVWVEAREALPALAAAEDAGRRGAVAALPLRAGGEILGAIGFTFDGPHPFDPKDRKLLASAAEQCALALDRARLLEAERRGRALLDAIVDNAPVGIAYVDRELRFRRVNPVLAEIDGREPAEHLGRTAREILPELAWDEVEASWRRVLESGEPLLDVEIEGETPSLAGRRTFLASWYPVRSGEEVIGVGALVHDVTAEREGERFQRHVVGVVGHDLRSPLSAIVMAAKVLAATPGLDATRKQLVGRIATSAERISELARALLDYAQVRAGGVPLNRRACDVAAIARTVAAECETAHPERAIACEGGPLRGEWDPDRLAQVLSNLVTNALEHGRSDAPVEVRWQREAGEAVVEVVNDGPPIPADALPHVFEPFRRADGRPHAGGLGLGLYIARAIVRAHGGRIEVRSNAADGTVFAVRLPLAAEARASA